MTISNPQSRSTHRKVKVLSHCICPRGIWSQHIYFHTHAPAGAARLDKVNRCSTHAQTSHCSSKRSGRFILVADTTHTHKVLQVLFAACISHSSATTLSPRQRESRRVACRPSTRPASSHLQLALDTLPQNATCTLQQYANAAARESHRPP